MILPSIVALFFIAGSGAGAETFHWTGKLLAGRQVEVKGVNGDITAERADGDTVEVLAQKTAGSATAADDVYIEVIDNDAGVTVCAVYPSRDARNGCQPGPDGGAKAPKNDTKVQFTVRVPDGVRFVGRTVNGSVRAIEMGADVEAHTINGKIVLSTSGAAMADTVNGSIKAATGAWHGWRRFSTVNGNIEIDLPKTVIADVNATTVHGRIVSDLPISAHPKLTTRRVARQGRLRGRCRELEVSTVNGSIILKKVDTPAV